MAILINRVSPAPKPPRVQRAEPKWAGGAVTVNGHVIPREEIAREVQNHTAPASDPGRAWADAARALAVRILLAQEADRQGIVPAPRSLGRGRSESAEEAILRQLLERELPSVRPTESAVRAAYEAHRERFKSPDLYEASHILFAPRAGGDDAAARAKAFARAAAALAIVRDAPGEFAAIARQESDCPSGAEGGRLGQMTEGETLPEFEAALKELSEGEIASEVVTTEHGFHIVRLDARAKGRVLPYETAAPIVADGLERAAWTHAARAFVTRLVEAAEIDGLALASD